MDRRDFLNALTTAGIAAGVARGVSRSSAPSTPPPKDMTERILDTRQLQCGYISYAPVLVKAPNTGRLSGLFYDLTERLGELLGLEVQWTAETTYATFTEDMQTGKYDVFGGGLWANPQRAKVVNFSLPAFYSGGGIYVRNDDRRFDDNPTKLDDPRVRIATIDGEMSQTIQQSDFPKTAVVSLPNTTDVSMLAETVASHKADATFMEKSVAALYLQKNPGTLRNLADSRPIRVFENVWSFAHGSERLRAMIDASVKEMIFSGFVDHVLAKYGQQDGFYRVASPVMSYNQGA